MNQLPYHSDILNWELAWAPYDPSTYEYVLEFLKPDDVVLDIGAGDLRLALLMTKKCEQVYALEIQKELIHKTITALHSRLPNNLEVIIADARLIPIPGNVTTGVLLMRHCQNFKLYADKLKAAGVLRLITNARWGMAVEKVDLQDNRIFYSALELGWYACWCGQSGFKPGLPERFTAEVDGLVNEVSCCPNCGQYLSYSC